MESTLGKRIMQNRKRLGFTQDKLADILGHSSIDTTRIYIISTGTEHRRLMENMRLVV